MQISLFDSLSRQISVGAISGYQKHVSPHKGFVCAHRVLYGTESCSQYIKRVVAQDGLKVAFVKSRERFQSCKQANHILKSQTENTEPTEEEETAQKPPISAPINSAFCNSNDMLNCADCADVSCNVAEIFSHTPDCGSLDCGAADCGSLDCSGADCGSLDCGSCGS